ncbi:hypothetical protein FPC831_2090004 [Flavobacterium psychrophilum]|nr:hypothetical protein FPC831_2090004 [Flavobacterium psychrophilum]
MPLITKARAVIPNKSLATLYYKEGSAIYLYLPQTTTKTPTPFPVTFIALKTKLLGAISCYPLQSFFRRKASKKDFHYYQG